MRASRFTALWVHVVPHASLPCSASRPHLDALPLPLRLCVLLRSLQSHGTLHRRLVAPLLYRRAAEQAWHARREAITQLQAAVSILATSAGTWIVLWMLHSLRVVSWFERTRTASSPPGHLHPTHRAAPAGLPVVQ